MSLLDTFTTQVPSWDLPSCVGFEYVFFDTGYQFDALFSKLLLGLSLFAALSKISLFGANSVAVWSISLSISFTSDGLADSMSIPSAKPLPSTNAMILVPHATIVIGGVPVDYPGVTRFLSASDSRSELLAAFAFQGPLVSVPCVFHELRAKCTHIDGTINSL